MNDIHIIRNLQNLISQLTIGSVIVLVIAIIGLLLAFIFVKALDEAVREDDKKRLFKGELEELEINGKVYHRGNLEELHGK